MSGYVVLYALLLALHSSVASGMADLFLFTVAAGRETAILHALEGPSPLPAWLVLGLSVLDDIGSLLFSIAAVWMLRSALRRWPRTGVFFLELEKHALRHQALVRRWGLAAIIALFFLPGLGSTGTLGAATLGVLAQVPVRRLAGWLVGAALVIDTFWVLSIQGVLGAIPEQPPWLGWVPLGIVAVALLVSVFELAGNWKHRHIVHLAAPVAPSPERQALLASWGIQYQDRSYLVDTRRLATVTGPAPVVRLRGIASLLRLRAMEPGQALELLACGVVRVHDLASVDPALVEAALAEAGVPFQEGLAHTWRGEAAAYAALEDSAWRA